MQAWTCRIALVAYLVGGWIMPSLHRHGMHQHAGATCLASSAHVHSSGACEGHAGSIPTGQRPSSRNQTDSPHVHEHDGHQHNDHHHGIHQESAQTDPADIPTSKPGVKTRPPSDHHDHGLCAMCVSRSLNGHRDTLFAPCFQSLATGIFHACEIPHHVQSRRSSNFSRGPPFYV